MRVVLIKIIWIAIQNSFLMANCAFKYNSKLTYTFPQIYMMQPTPSGDFQHKIHNEMMFVFQQMANESALFYFSFCGQPGEKIAMLLQLHFQSHQFATIKADLAHKRRRVKLHVSPGKFHQTLQYSDLNVALSQLQLQSRIFRIDVIAFTGFVFNIWHSFWWL